MTGLEIIKEIRRLPVQEREKVRRFIQENLEPGQLSGEEIGALVQKMIEATDPGEARGLEDEIVRGFYGDTQISHEVFVFAMARFFIGLPQERCRMDGRDHFRRQL